MALTTPNPSFWARFHDSALICKSCVVNFVNDNITGFLIGNNGATPPVDVGSVIIAGTQSYSVVAGTVLNGGLSGEPWPRCLTMTMRISASGSSRGGTWRIQGVNQFGENVMEDMAFGAQAIGGGGVPAVYQMATRYAYRYVTQVDKVSFTGTPSGSDTISLGITRNTIAATSGAFLTLNGSRLRQFSGFGLPMPVNTIGTTAAGAASGGVGSTSGGYESEINGCIVGEAGGVTFTQTLVRTGSGGLETTRMFVDPVYSIMVPSDLQPPTGPGVGVYEYQINVTSKRGL